MAIGIYLMMIVFVLWKWRENYGDREAKASASFVSAIKVIRTGEVDHDEESFFWKHDI